MKNSVQRAAALILVTVVLWLHCRRYLPLFQDDAFISLRYAQRFLNGEGLTWGEPPVEGYSNLLWILLISALGFLGVDLVTAARALGFLLTLGAAAAVFFFGKSRRPFPIANLIGALTLALAVPVAAWSIGGLEQPLVAFLLAWSLVLVSHRVTRPHVTPRSMFVPAILLGLLCLTRPDSPVLVAAIVAGFFLVRGVGRAELKAATILVAGAAVCVVGQQIFRVAYYGNWVPNPALVKITFSARHIREGLDYVTAGFWALMPVSLLVVAAAGWGLWRTATRPRFVVPCLAGAAWALYLVAVGGDIFRSWRGWIPIIVVMVIVIAEGLAEIERRFPTVRGRGLLALGATAVFALFLYHQNRDERNRSVLVNQSEWDGQVVGWMLKDSFGTRRPLLAVDAAGSVPYWSQLPAIDMLGLNDAHIARHRPEDVGKGYIGHELGDGAYVLGRRPDLVIFWSPHGREKAVYLSGRQMQALPEFAEQYKLVTFEGRRPYTVRSKIWVRKHGDPLGIGMIARDNFIYVPSYLFDVGAEAVAYVWKPGEVVVDITPTSPAVVRGLTLLPGGWHLHVCANRPVHIVVRASEDSSEVARGDTKFQFECTSEGPELVDVEMACVEPGTTVVHGLELDLRRDPSKIVTITRIGYPCGPTPKSED
ncbi:MAG TPA: hypothetical protein VJZ71_10425 [Phycisphaerae bacterium]|nr:hypothetical protein [Phycisphaerae bacterium]